MTGNRGFSSTKVPSGIIDSSTIIYHMAARDDRLWLGTNKGLVKLDLSVNRQHQLIPLEFGDADARISTIVPDQLGQIWILTNEGLYCYRGQELGLYALPAGGGKHPFPGPKTQRASSGRSQDGQIWFGTFGNGVYQIDPASLSYKHFVHNPADPESLSENSINCIFQDRAGVTWIGTFGAGISIMDPHSNRFKLFKNNPFNPEQPGLFIYLDHMRNFRSESMVWHQCPWNLMLRPATWHFHTL